tara:strand:- start:98 stop:385 length:288 start_codon:yes stop_codon:yes gene_type:complete
LVQGTTFLHRVCVLLHHHPRPEEFADDSEAAQEIQECVLEHYSCPCRVLKSPLLNITKERKERRVQALLKTIEEACFQGDAFWYGAHIDSEVCFT